MKLKQLDIMLPNCRKSPAKAKILKTISTCKSWAHADNTRKMYCNYKIAFGRDEEIEKDLFIKLMMV